MIPLDGHGKICSFCGEEWSLERRFMGGYGAQVCVECIDRFNELLADRGKFESARKPHWDEMPKEELLDKLPHIVATSQQVEEFLHGWVGILRDRGASWQEIGLALGVSRQAAWERFTRVRRGLTRDVESG